MATAAVMVTAIKTALESSESGIVSINIDGMSVQYDRASALRELVFWESRVARETGARPRASQIRLDGF